MNEIELLSWLRGTGMQISVGIFVAGMLFRILHNLVIGMPQNLAQAKGSYFTPGVATIFRRSWSPVGKSYRGYYTMVAGYCFHIGLFVTILFLEQHILFFKSIIGFGWPALSPALIDLAALLGIGALVAVLLHRIIDPVLRHLSDFQDYLTWLLTFAPLLTGYITQHPIAMSYQTALIVHLICVDFLLIAAPFTKLTHMVSLFVGRWYNGALAGYRGAKS